MGDAFGFGVVQASTHERRFLPAAQAIRARTPLSSDHAANLRLSCSLVMRQKKKARERASSSDYAQFVFKLPIFPNSLDMIEYRLGDNRTTVALTLFGVRKHHRADMLSLSCS
jgi:hypothetical protein